MNTKAGQNDLCPCGSEKKYKRCCGRQVEVYGSAEKKSGLVLGLFEGQQDIWIQAEKKRDMEFLTGKPDLMRRIAEEARQGSRPFVLVDRRTGVVQGFRGKDITETITQLGKKAEVAEAIRSRLEILGEGEFLMCVVSGSGHVGLYRMMTSEIGRKYLELWGMTSGRGH